MDDGHAARQLARGRGDAHRIKSLTPIRNIDNQCVGATIRLIDQLAKHVANLHLGHAFCLDSQTLVGRIRVKVDCYRFVFLHFGRRIIDLQGELVRVALDGSGSRGAVGGGIIGIKPIIIEAFHVGGVVLITRGRRAEQLDSRVGTVLR